MKRFLMLLLAMMMAFSMAFCFTACGEDEDDGSGDSGSGDTGSGDSGSGDTGSGDSGSGDSGSGDTGSGDRDEDDGVDEIRSIYNSYVVAVTARGETPLSYEEWLATVKGDKGDPGAPGKDGTVWHVGEGAPSTVSGAKLGDFYINKTSFEVYHLTASGWTLLGSIKGEDGEDASGSGSQGAPGKDGTVWHTGAGAPINVVGAKEGDLYLDTASSNIYKYSSGLWAKIGNIKGDKGDDTTGGGSGTVWHFGAGAPINVFGAKDGDCYLDTDSYAIYRLEGGSWTIIATVGSGNSGEGSSDVDRRRQEIKDNASQRYEELAAKYDITEEQSYEFFNLIDKLSVTDTIEQLDRINNNINELFEAIEGITEAPYVIYYELSIDVRQMTVGTDIDEFMEKNFVGTYIIAHFSDGTSQNVYVFHDDNGVNVTGSWEKVGDVFYIEVYLGIGQDTVELWHEVYVVADKSDSTVDTYFFGENDTFGMETITVIQLSTGEYFAEIAGEGYHHPAVLDGNILTVDVSGVRVLFVLEKGDNRNTVSCYAPEGEPFLTVREETSGVFYEFYGDYSSAGDYLAFIYTQDNRSAGFSSYVYIDCEAKTFASTFADGIVRYDDNNIIPNLPALSEDTPVTDRFMLAVFDSKCDDILFDFEVYYSEGDKVTLEQLLAAISAIANYDMTDARAIINYTEVKDASTVIKAGDLILLAPSDAIIFTGIFNYGDSTETMQAFLPYGATLEVFIGMYGGATRDIYINGKPVEFEANRELVLNEGDEISATIGGENVAPDAPAEPSNPGGTENGGEDGGNANGFDQDKVTNTWVYQTDPSLMGTELIIVYALNDGSYYMHDGYSSYLPVSLWHDRTLSLSMGGVTMLITLDDTNGTAYWYGGSSEIIMTVTLADGSKTAIIYNDTHATDGMYVARLFNDQGNTWTALINYDSDALTVTAIPLGWYDEIITLTDKDKGTVGGSGNSDEGDDSEMPDEAVGSYMLHIYESFNVPGTFEYHAVYKDSAKTLIELMKERELSIDTHIIVYNRILVNKEISFLDATVGDGCEIIIAPLGGVLVTLDRTKLAPRPILINKGATLGEICEIYALDTNAEITVDGKAVADPDTVLTEGCEIKATILKDVYIQYTEVI